LALYSSFVVRDIVANVGFTIYVNTTLRLRGLFQLGYIRT
jgi:hypothetical protein